jgi:dihydroxyacetone kinase
MLWGAMLLELGKSLGDTEPATPEAVVRAVRAATDEVKRLGKSDVGDKTLLDALVPFADALEANVAEGQDLAAAWASAAEKADEGAKSTKDMRPRVGRARPLAERSVGNPDPGAVSMALCLAAVGRTLGEG